MYIIYKDNSKIIPSFVGQKNIWNNVELSIVNNDSLEREHGDNIGSSSKPVSKGSTQHPGNDLVTVWLGPAMMQSWEDQRWGWEQRQQKGMLLDPGNIEPLTLLWTNDSEKIRRLLTFIAYVFVP